MRVGETRYLSLNNALKKRYGKKVFKVSLDANFTCPNKDGTKGVGGCIFCSPSGSGDFAGNALTSLKTQYQTVKANMLKKWPDALTIPYFQANTNTYADVETLRTLFYTAINLDKSIVGLAIATRCDALDEATVDLLAELNQHVDVSVELGLQTIHEPTAKRLNRAHSTDCVQDAVTRLHSRGIETVIHIINGLPHESEAMMLDTAKYVNRLGVQGIKIHMLHIMKNTALGAMYQQKPFELLTLEQYANIVVKQIALLNPNMVIHRLTGDSPKDTLIAPTWTLKKFVVLNTIDALLKRHNIVQGCHL